MSNRLKEYILQWQSKGSNDVYANTDVVSEKEAYEKITELELMYPNNRYWVLCVADYEQY